MAENEKIEFELLSPKELSGGILDSMAREIRSYVTPYSAQTVVYFMISLFSILTDLKILIPRLKCKSDWLGGLDLDLFLGAGKYYFWVKYCQEIDSDYHSVNRSHFDYGVLLPDGMELSLDLILSSSGYLKIGFSGLGEDKKEKVLKLFAQCFSSVQTGEAVMKNRLRDLEEAQALPQRKNPAKKEVQEMPENRIKKLMKALDENRDPYMEWHDGPDYSSIENAVRNLQPEEKQEAEKLIIERLSQSYNNYLGRAAVLLGSEGCKKALENLLDIKNNSTDLISIAENVLSMNPNQKALQVIKSVISAKDLGWSARINASLTLQTAMRLSKNQERFSELMPEDLREALLCALCDDDYLVRYHCANTLLMFARVKNELSENKELFSLICGSHSDGKPDEKDRAGFLKAQQKILEILRNSSL